MNLIFFGGENSKEMHFLPSSTAFKIYFCVAYDVRKKGKWFDIKVIIVDNLLRGLVNKVPCTYSTDVVYIFSIKEIVLNVLLDGDFVS